MQLDTLICMDTLRWEPASPRTHKPKIVNESLNSLQNESVGL